MVRRPGQASVAESSVLPPANRGVENDVYRNTLDNTPINARPDCPQCAAQMYLARIEPERPGHDLRTFECPRCQHVETAVVKFK